jgi:hypothetical protein
LRDTFNIYPLVRAARARMRATDEQSGRVLAGNVLAMLIRSEGAHARTHTDCVQTILAWTI